MNQKLRSAKYWIRRIPDKAVLWYLRKQGSGYARHAKREFGVLGWPGDCEMQGWICDHMLAMLGVFSMEGHSGSSAPYAVSLFKDLAMFKPISPLTGEDSEWSDVHGGTLQNNRCSEVFKDDDSGAYWAFGKVFRHPDGCCYTTKNSRVPIEFPWTMPDKPEYVEVEE